MKTKTVQENLQKAYHSMLKHVEDLVEKDKKPLKQAFVEAEEKLSEWRELSREEIAHISDELKSNFSDMGDASNRLNESLKETLSFDTSYLASSIWNRLSKVADQTMIELSELGDDLQKHMTTDASNQTEQQQCWFNEAQQWQGDYEIALKQLDSIRSDLRKKIRKVSVHNTAISNEKTDQAEHNRLAQINSETVYAISDLYNQLKLRVRSEGVTYTNKPIS